MSNEILEVSVDDIDAVRHYTNSLGDDVYVPSERDVLLSIALQHGDIEDAEKILERGKQLYNAGYRVKKSEWELRELADFEVPDEAIVYKVKDAGYSAMQPISRLWWLVKI
jgi:hypothetical protein